MFILIHYCSKEPYYIIMAKKLGKDVTLIANPVNLFLVSSVVSLDGKDTLYKLVLPHGTSTKRFLTQWGNIVNYVVTILVVEVISSCCKIVLDREMGLGGKQSYSCKLVRNYTPPMNHLYT